MITKEVGTYTVKIETITDNITVSSDFAKARGYSIIENPIKNIFYGIFLIVIFTIMFIFFVGEYVIATGKVDKDGNLLPDAERLTKFGKLLRSTSLDELPELFNIARGDMAIVGPRPLLTQYLPYYREEERERHAIRPGLTGLAQVRGRNYLMWDERIALDVEYAKKITLLGDLKIILLTIVKVIKRSDVAEKRITPLDQARKDEKGN